MVTAVLLGDALEEEIDEDVRRELPKHRRCGAHTVSLMGTADVDKVESLSNIELYGSLP